MATCMFHFQKQTINTIMVRCFAKHKCRYLCHDGRQERLSSRQYWRQKYTELEKEDAFDWFLSQRTLSNLADLALSSINPMKQPTLVNVLDLGCGKSLLPKCVYGWKQFPVAVFCLDYVQEALNFQLDTVKTAPPGHSGNHVYGLCANVCQLPFKSGSFSLITDKGTMDALLKNFKDGASQAKEMLSEVQRVLQDGGIFMQITDEDPDSRLYFLETNSQQSKSGQWTFSVLIDDANKRQECFLYMFQK